MGKAASRPGPSRWIDPAEGRGLGQDAQEAGTHTRTRSIQAWAAPVAVGQIIWFWIGVYEHLARPSTGSTRPSFFLAVALSCTRTGGRLLSSRFMCISARCLPSRGEATSGCVPFGTNAHVGTDPPDYPPYGLSTGRPTVARPRPIVSITLNHTPRHSTPIHELMCTPTSTFTSIFTDSLGSKDRPRVCGALTPDTMSASSKVRDSFRLGLASAPYFLAS